jgi:hypothetical protein
MAAYPHEGLYLGIRLRPSMAESRVAHCLAESLIAIHMVGVKLILLSCVAMASVPYAILVQ